MPIIERKSIMKYSIEGNFSPVLTIFINKNELLSAKAGSDGWHSPHICEINSADNIIDALKNGLSEDRLFSRKYTSYADDAEITLIPEVSPCTIYPAEVSESSPLLLTRSAFLAASGGAKLTPYISKTFGEKRFELCEAVGSGTVFLQLCGNVIKRDLGEDEELIVRSEQLAACSKSCRTEIYRENSDIMLKISNGNILLSTARN